MKKLYMLSILALGVSASAQVFKTENFNSYTPGNVATDTSGTTAGPSGYYISGGAPSDYQFATVDAAHGISLKITSGATATSSASSRFTWDATDYATLWGARTSGNDILNGAVRIYTGTSTGVNRPGMVIYGEDGTGIIGIAYNTSTKVMTGFARLTSDSTGTTAFYGITFSGQTQIPANTWVPAQISYDSKAGAYNFTFGGNTTTLAITGYSVPTGLVPGEVDFVSLVSTGNTAANTSAIDDVTIAATNSATLGVKGGTIGEAVVSVYPNPAVDFVKVSGGNIKSAKVTEMSGRNITLPSTKSEIDVRNLAKGVYVIQITLDNGQVHTQKIIKK